MNNQSPELKDLAKALAAAQASLSAAAKDAVNPHFKNHYATLQSVWNAAREVLAPNGLSIVQTFSATDGTRMDITTTLLHVSGQWMAGTLSMIPQRPDPQGIGSAITYGRRYALAAILGIVADEDDDGEAASKPAASNGHTSARQVTQAAAPAQRELLGQAVSWKDCVIHFGKNKGAALGSLQERQLMWYIQEWQPKPYNGKVAPEDTALRNALDRAGDEFLVPAGRAPATAPKASARSGPSGQVALPADDGDDQVPF